MGVFHEFMTVYSGRPTHGVEVGFDESDILLGLSTEKLECCNAHSSS